MGSVNRVVSLSTGQRVRGRETEVQSMEVRADDHYSGWSLRPACAPPSLSQTHFGSARLQRPALLRLCSDLPYCSPPGYLVYRLSLCSQSSFVPN